jgi:hypothetical protein
MRPGYWGEEADPLRPDDWREVLAQLQDWDTSEVEPDGSPRVDEADPEVPW